MIGCVIEEVGRGLGEERGATAVLLGKNYLVEKPDRWVIRASRLPFMDELIEGCVAMSADQFPKSNLLNLPCVSRNMAKYS